MCGRGVFRSKPSSGPAGVARLGLEAESVAVSVHSLTDCKLRFTLLASVSGKGARPRDTGTIKWVGTLTDYDTIVDFEDPAASSLDDLDETIVDLDRRTISRPGPRVSVVVPTYNEAANLPHVFGQLPPDIFEVIVVDGRSTDGTVEVAVALRPDVRIVLQNRRGKGNAVACGFAAVRGDIVVMLDADGSAHPQEISCFVEALLDGADFAKGTRFATGGGSADITATRRWGNRLLNRAANALFSTGFTDLCYGYNALWTRCLPALELDATGDRQDSKLWGDGFEIETIINARAAKAGLRIIEVPSFEYNRIHGESNLNTWRDGMRVLRALIVEWVDGRRRHPQRCSGGYCGALSDVASESAVA